MLSETTRDSARVHKSEGDTGRTAYYRIGRNVTVHTYKAQGIDSMGHTGEAHRGKIVEHYKHFALVRLPSGVLDSVLWPDLVLQMRKKKNPGITSPEIKN